MALAAIYPPPMKLGQTIFNPNNFLDQDYLTLEEGNQLYIIKTGADTDIGPLTITSAGKLASASRISPSFSFVNETTSGLYLNSPSDIRMSIGGFDSVGFESGGIRLYNSVSGYNPSLLGYYEVVFVNNIVWSFGTLNLTGSGIKCVRVGRLVILELYGATLFFGTSTGDGVYSQAGVVPLRIRPSVDVNCGPIYTGNTVDNISIVRITTNGDIICQFSAGTITTNPVIQAFSCRYTLT